MKAAIYVRVSTEEQAKEGYSIDAQKKILQEYCVFIGCEVCSIYCDAGMSGGTMHGRKGLNEMLKSADKKEFDMLLVWKLSRLSRNLKDLLTIVDRLEKNGTALISFSERFDTSTPAGRMTLQILGSIAEFERNTIAENIKLAMESKAKKGQWNGGNTPFGYMYDTSHKVMKIKEGEAEVVRKIFGLYREGRGYYSICNFLNNNGFLTRSGGKFATGMIRNIISNKAYCGNQEYNKYSYKKEGGIFKRVRNKDVIIVKGIFPSIISEDDFNEVQEITGHRKYRYLRNEGFILSGILKCPICKSAMVGSTTSKGNKKYRYYKCSRHSNSGSTACTMGVVNASRIESEVIAEAFLYIDRKPLMDDLKKKIEYIEALDNSKFNRDVWVDNKKDRLLNLLLDGTIDDITYKRKINQLNENKKRNPLKNESARNTCPDTLKLKNVVKLIFSPGAATRGLMAALIKEVIINRNGSLEKMEYNFKM